MGRGVDCGPGARRPEQRILPRSVRATAALEAWRVGRQRQPSRSPLRQDRVPRAGDSVTAPRIGKRGATIQVPRSVGVRQNHSGQNHGGTVCFRMILPSMILPLRLPGRQNQFRRAGTLPRGGRRATGSGVGESTQPYQGATQRRQGALHAGHDPSPLRPAEALPRAVTRARRDKLGHCPASLAEQRADVALRVRIEVVVVLRQRPRKKTWGLLAVQGRERTNPTSTTTKTTTSTQPASSASEDRSLLRATCGARTGQARRERASSPRMQNRTRHRDKLGGEHRVRTAGRFLPWHGIRAIVHFSKIPWFFCDMCARLASFARRSDWPNG